MNTNLDTRILELEKTLERNNLRGYALIVDFESLEKTFTTGAKFSTGDVASNSLVIQLLNNKEVIVLDKNDAVYILVKKPTGDIVYLPCDILNGEQGIIITKLDIDSVSESGIYEFDITITNGKDYKMVSPRMSYNTYENIGKVLEDPSGEKVTILDTLIAEVNTAKKFNQEKYDLVLALSTENANLEIIDARNGSKNLGTRLTNIETHLEENMNKIAETKNMLGIETCKGKVRHIFCEGDSLTHGTNKSYVDFLRDTLRSQIGDGGAGLVMFDNTMISRENISLGYSSGLTLLHSLDNDAIPRIYSICGQGLYTDSGDGSDYITFNVNRKYDKMKVFYLKQPNGGTFKIGFTNVDVASHTTIDTNGDLGLDYVEITADTSKGSGIKMSSITGKVCLFGAFSYIENDGVTISRLAYGGDRLEYHHNTDSTFRQKWVELLQPSNYLICLGMNDRTDITQENFKTWTSDIVSDIQTGCANTNITLIRSSDSGDTETTALNYYATLLKEIAEEKRVGFLDFRNILGDYENMVKNNWITSDKIHLTENGYSTEASYIAQYLGFNSNYVYKGITPFGTTEKTYNYINNLSTKTISIDNAGSSIIYKLGIANAYSIALLKLDITGSKHGTAHICKKECYISLANGTVVNQVTSIGDLATTSKYTTGTNPTPDFTVTAEINNNLLEITITNNSGNYKMDFCVSGQITFSYLTVKGTSVYEN